MRLLRPGLALRETGAVCLMFPVWWYTRGASQCTGELRRRFLSSRLLLRVRILLCHLFTPLFGYSALEMRIIGVALRFPVTLSVLLWTIACTVGTVALLLCWLLAPVVVTLALAYQLHLLPSFLP